jgi:hypothetical protein
MSGAGVLQPTFCIPISEFKNKWLASLGASDKSNRFALLKIRIHAPGIEDPVWVEGLFEAPVHLFQGW